jgi:glycosyltransferase involved in cell wall biosynthesis
MKVLVVHNRYRQAMPSGENRVVDDELAALRAAGVQVEPFFRSSDELATMSVLGKARASVSPITGSASRSELGETLRRLKPDVVHVHNPYPLISPRVVEMAADAGVAVVATIHNFRLQCMNGLMYRDGHICTECEGKWFPVAGIRHSCYRESLPQSALMATAISLHRRRWDRVDRFIAVSEFVADRLASWGVDRDRIAVKPNPVPDPGPPAPPGRGFLFAGRLAEEKGILLLLDAWERSGLDGVEELLIAGDGPLMDEVTRRAERLRSVTFLGILDAAEIGQTRQRTAVGVTCSLWFEAHPAVAESFAHGRPVIATNVGALGAIVAACNSDVVAQRGRAARARFIAEYRSDVVTDQLIDIYESVNARR